MVHEQVTERVIGCAMRVANVLGCGFLEKVYENALVVELRKVGLTVQQQCPVSVYYEGALVGEYVADVVVEGCVLLELKACSGFDSSHTAQCLNYLKATGLSVCLLINFGKSRLEFKRIVGATALSSAAGPSV